MYIALSKGTNRSPIFEFCVFAALPSLTSLILQQRMLRSMFRLKIVSVDFLTANVVDLRKDTYKVPDT